jgi:hypothetical protein
MLVAISKKHIVIYYRYIIILSLCVIDIFFRFEVFVSYNNIIIRYMYIYIYD